MRKLSSLVDKIKEVEYPLIGKYVDESKNILEELGLEEEEDNSEVKSGYDNDDDIKVCKRHFFVCVCVCVLLDLLRKTYSQIKGEPTVFSAFQQFACKNLKMSQINQGSFYPMH